MIPSRNEDDALLQACKSYVLREAEVNQLEQRVRAAGLVDLATVQSSGAEEDMEDVGIRFKGRWSTGEPRSFKWMYALALIATVFQTFLPLLLLSETLANYIVTSLSSWRNLSPRTL